MNEIKMELKIPKDIVNIAKKNDIGLCVPISNSATVADDIIPDKTGILIGCVDKDTGELQSNIKDDASCDELRKYIDTGIATEKIFTQMAESGELKDVPHYFIVYDVTNSSKFIPTYTEDGPGDGYPTNGYYDCNYEILIGCDDLTRRIVFNTHSVNVPLNDWLDDILEQIEAAFEGYDGHEDIPENLFTKSNDETTIVMFDSVGLRSNIECSCASAFKAMIRSIRQISCTFIRKD